jgi:hypothetical protein
LPYSWEFFLYFSMQIPAVLLGVQNTLRCGMEAAAILTWLNCEYDLRRCLMNAPLAFQSFVQLCFFAPSSLSCFLHGSFPFFFFFSEKKNYQKSEILQRGMNWKCSHLFLFLQTHSELLQGWIYIHFFSFVQGQNDKNFIFC